jgi:hypothetical protein
VTKNPGTRAEFWARRLTLARGRERLAAATDYARAQLKRVPEPHRTRIAEKTADDLVNAINQAVHKFTKDSDVNPRG